MEKEVKNVIESLNKIRNEKINERARENSNIGFADWSLFVVPSEYDDESVRLFEWITENMIGYDGYYVDEYGFSYDSNIFQLKVNFKTEFFDNDIVTEMEGLEIVNDIKEEFISLMRKENFEYENIYHDWE